MKVFPQNVRYSSIVGGGLMLVDENGAARFNVILSGATDGITKEQNDALSEHIRLALSDGVELP